MSGLGHIETVPAKLSGQRAYSLLKCRREIFLPGSGYSGNLGKRINQKKVKVITRDSEEFKELTGWIKKTGKAVEDATARIRPTVADEHYMTGDDVCAMLHISRRTLQTLRDEKLVPYTTIGGKLLYPESSLYEVLKKNYRDFRRFRK